MHLLYLLALVPIGIGMLLWLVNKQVVWWEWLVGGAIAFIVAGITHAVALKGLLDDVETYSGQITHAVHIPTWVEYYEEAIYKTEYYTTTESYTDSNGKRQTRTVRKSRRVFSHWESRRRTHPEQNIFFSNIGTEYRVSKDDYNHLAEKFGPNSIETRKGKRHTGEHNSKMISGDPLDYVAQNRSGWVQPVTKLVHWENRIKAGPSVYSYEPVPEGVAVYDWPENPNPFSSNRLIGQTGQIDAFLLDQMNARLGPTKYVNVIIIGFGDKPQSYARYQEAKWIGGKKNDLVICFGGPYHDKADWAYVFGWTDKNIVKRNIESLVLQSPIDNALLTQIEAEIKQNYKLRDWSEFDYISVQPKTSTYIWFIIMMIITQSIFYWFAHHNGVDKGSKPKYIR